MILFVSKRAIERLSGKWQNNKFRKRVKLWSYLFIAALTFTHCYSSYRQTVGPSDPTDSPVATAGAAAIAGAVWPIYWLAHAAPLIWGERES